MRIKHRGTGRGDAGAEPGNNWWVHNRRIWISPPARKQNCTFDSRGPIKGKLDIKGCFKKSFGCQGNGAEGIQSRK